MKDYKIMFAAVGFGLSVLIIGLFTVAVFNYIAFLKEQNYTLLENINSSISQLTNSVMSLKSHANIQELAALKNENVSLKKQAEKLQHELKGIRGKEALADEPVCAGKESVGNRGFFSVGKPGR